MEYVSNEGFASIMAAMQARQQAARLKRFTGKRERTFRVNVVVCDVLGGSRQEIRTIKGFTLQDAKSQAGIA